jgi:hypothetical protein
MLLSCERAKFIDVRRTELLIEPDSRVSSCQIILFS